MVEFKKLTVIGLIVVAICMVASNSAAQQLLQLKQLKTVPTFNTGEGEGEGAPKIEFDGIGRVDRMDDHAIVVDDSWYKLSGYVAIKNADGELTGFQPKSENRVGFMIDEKHEVTEIWILR